MVPAFNSVSLMEETQAGKHTFYFNQTNTMEEAFLRSSGSTKIKHF